MGGSSSKPSFRALVLGLDSAGKTTLLKGLTGQDIPEGPTTTHNIGSLKLKTGSALLFDLGGQQKLISFWRQYYTGAGIILFVIDSSDTQRVHNAKDELYRLIHEEELIGIPLLVIANKQDMPGALSPQDIAAELELSYLEPRNVAVLPASAKSQEGFAEIRKWVQDYAVHVVDISRHLEQYNQQLSLVRAQKRKKSVFSHSGKNGQNNEDLEDSLRMTHLNSTNTFPHSTTHSTDTNNTAGNSTAPNVTISNQSGRDFSSPTDKPITALKDHHHHDPVSTSLSHNTTISLTTTNTNGVVIQSNNHQTLRRPRLTLSVEQRVLQQQLHQQLIAHTSKQDETSSHHSYHSTQTEQLNHEGIPINSRLGDEFSPQQDDVILETKIMLSEASQARKGSIHRILVSPTETQHHNSTSDLYDLPVSDGTQFNSDADLSTQHVASHFTTPTPTHALQAQSTPDVKVQSPPELSPNLQPQTLTSQDVISPPPTERLSVSSQHDPTGRSSIRDSSQPDQSIPRRPSTLSHRTSITNASPAQRQRRCSSTNAPSLSNDEMEGMTRSRKISLSQREMEEEMEDEFNTLHENPVAPFEETTPLQQEPDLDTVNEQQMEEDE